MHTAATPTWKPKAAPFMYGTDWRPKSDPCNQSTEERARMGQDNLARMDNKPLNPEIQQWMPVAPTIQRPRICDISGDLKEQTNDTYLPLPSPKPPSRSLPPTSILLHQPLTHQLPTSTRPAPSAHQRAKKSQTSIDNHSSV